MTHQRQNIRDSVKDILDGASIVAAGKVFTNRDLKVQASELPVLTIYTLPETSRPRDQTTTVLQRNLTLVVEAQLASADAEDTDDDVDDIADDIESAMKADQTFGGVAQDSNLTSTDWQKDEQGGEASVGILRLTYSVTYFQ